MMEWTVERVRLRLGLKQWRLVNVERDQYHESIRDCFSEEAWAGPLGRGRCYPRRTGRTMYTKLMAVAAAGNGHKVHLVGHNRRITRILVAEARKMAQACDIDPMAISQPEKLHLTAEDRVGRHSETEPWRFEDHHVFEAEYERRRALWALRHAKESLKIC